MGLIRMLKLEGPDIAAFFVAGLMGYLVSTLVPPGLWSTLTYVLVSYHIFLVWLVLTGERDAAIQLPIVSTIITHLACLTLVLPLGFARHFLSMFLAGIHPSLTVLLLLIFMRFLLPVTSVLRYAVTALAVFERYWLFSADEVQKVNRPIEVAPSPVLQAATADDMRDWQQHLAQMKPGSRPMGSSLKAEYEQWLLARRPTGNAVVETQSTDG